MLVLFACAWVGLSVAGWAAQPPGAKAPPGKGKPVAKAPVAAPKPAASPAAPAVPSKYRELPVDEAQKKNTAAVRSILGSGTASAEQQAQVDAYLTKYMFPRWTAAASFESVKETPRREVATALANARAGALYEHVVTMILGFMSQTAADNTYHPAVRVNAMLMIGELTTAQRGASGPAGSLPAALPVLLTALNDPNQIDAVKVAALLGLGRHAGSPTLDAQIRDRQLIPALLALVNAPVPQGRSPAGHAWMRMLAIDALGASGQAGANGAIATTLADVAGSKANPMMVRRAAARALGGLDYSGAASVSTLGLAYRLGTMLLEAFSEESTRPVQLSASSGGSPAGAAGYPGMGTPYPGAGGYPPMGRSPGAGGYPRGGGGYPPDVDRPAAGMPGLGGAELPAEPDEHATFFRRLYKADLLAIRFGLVGARLDQPRGLKGLAVQTADAKANEFIDSLVKIIDEQSKALDDAQADLPKLKQNLGPSIAKLTKLRSPAAAPAAPAGKAPPADAPAAPDPKAPTNAPGPPAKAPAKT